MNLMGLAPYQKGQKPAKPPRKRMRQVSPKKAAYRASEAGKEGSAYMGKVKQLPCVCCQQLGRVQCSPTEVHHVKSGRFGNLRESDKCVIPLCHSHHNKLRPYPGDEVVAGYHNGQETWERKFGPDYGFIPPTRALVAAMNDTIDF